MGYQELTGKVIGCAHAVYNKTGYGFLESAHERFTLIELEKPGLPINFGEEKAEIKRKVKESG